jgi:hypothetical protein
MARQDQVIKRTKKLGKGYIKRIHVDQFKIRNHEPDPITIQTSDGSLKAAEIEILGESQVVFRPEHPLSCGARLWIETKSEVRITKGI